MLSRIEDWRRFLSEGEACAVDDAVIRKHSRIGHPLGRTEFVTEIESLTGRVLAARKPGPKPEEER